MGKAIRVWMNSLDDYPGWKEWRLEKFAHTLYFDEPNFASPRIAKEFNFSRVVENQHALINQYFGLLEAVFLLKECEYYFRRFPFQGLPISKHSHVTNVCEMYFGRLYVFKELLRKYFKELKRVYPNHQLDIGNFVNLFSAEFRFELSERNKFIHHRRFSSMEINRLFLLEFNSDLSTEEGWGREQLAEYRRITKSWALRVRNSGVKLDQFVEAVAEATLKNCDFLKT
jgi:hypothetical protein